MLPRFVKVVEHHIRPESPESLGSRDNNNVSCIKVKIRRLFFPFLLGSNAATPTNISHHKGIIANHLMTITTALVGAGGESGRLDQVKIDQPGWFWQIQLHQKWLEQWQLTMDRSTWCLSDLIAPKWKGSYPQSGPNQNLLVCDGLLFIIHN